MPCRPSDGGGGEGDSADDGRQPFGVDLAAHEVPASGAQAHRRQRHAEGDDRCERVGAGDEANVDDRERDEHAHDGPPP